MAASVGTEEHTMNFDGLHRSILEMLVGALMEQLTSTRVVEFARPELIHAHHAATLPAPQSTFELFDRSGGAFFDDPALVPVAPVAKSHHCAPSVIPHNMVAHALQRPTTKSPQP